MKSHHFFYQTATSFMPHMNSHAPTADCICCMETGVSPYAHHKHPDRHQERMNQHNSGKKVRPSFATVTPPTASQKIKMKRHEKKREGRLDGLTSTQKKVKSHVKPEQSVRLTFKGTQHSTSTTRRHPRATEGDKQEILESPNFLCVENKWQGHEELSERVSAFNVFDKPLESRKTNQ